MSKSWKVGETFTTDYGWELTLGPDIDLEKEIVILSDGQRLTNQVVAEMAECDCCSDAKSKNYSGQ
jgi:hypothetical protein